MRARSGTGTRPGAESADEVRLCSADRFFPPEFMRQLVTERLNLTSDEIAAGHCVHSAVPLTSPRFEWLRGET